MHGAANAQDVQRREGLDAGGNGARQLIVEQASARDVIPGHSVVPGTGVANTCQTHYGQVGAYANA